MKKYTVTLLPQEIKTEYPEETLLLDILMDQGLPIESPCGGKGICGKCIVKTEGELSPGTPSEESFIISPELRLACQAKTKGDVIIYTSFREQKEMTLPGINEDSSLSIAVDIGTTSVKIAFIDNASEKIKAKTGFLNPQRIFGHDVISRISAAMTGKSRHKIQQVLAKEISAYIKSILENSGIENERVKKIIFSGNTTMIYFLAGIDTSPLGRHPYTAETLDFDRIEEKTIADTFPAAEINALPCASAWLGGDLTGGMALVFDKGFKENTFFIDLGTNGEMFIAEGTGKVYATSCAMGPALEGMNISCGMTAAEGAITHFYYDEETESIDFSVQGDAEAAGISGTGLIDIAAILLETGIMDKTGSFHEEMMHRIPCLEFRPDEGRIMINDRIYITRKDIRSLQLARAASLAAAQLLIKEANINPGTVKNVIIAGAFGENLDIDNFKALSFLPVFENAEYSFIGNSSLDAAAAVCIDHEFYSKIKQARDSIKIIELSTHKEFNDVFLESINF